MTVEIGVLIAIVSMLLAIYTFFFNRQHAAKKDGATLAVVKKDIEYIAKEIKSIRESLDKRDEKYDESIRRLHDRMDEHIAKYHT